MDHEFKIIVSGDLNSTVKVYVDNTQIGLIQDIKFSANTQETHHKIEITFPNLFTLDESIQINSDLIQSLKVTLDLLKEIPYVKVNLIDI